MKHSPSGEVTWLSVSQEINHILWNQKVHYYCHNSSPPDPNQTFTHLMFLHKNCKQFPICYPHTVLKYGLLYVKIHLPGFYHHGPEGQIINLTDGNYVTFQIHRHLFRHA